METCVSDEQGTSTVWHTPPFLVTIASNTDCTEEMCWAMLTEHEKIRSLRIPHSKKDDWILGRVASKRVIQAYGEKRMGYSISPQDIEILSRIGMPPTFILAHGSILPPGPYILTLSHSHGVAVAQMCERRGANGIGIDIERVRDFDETTLRAFLTDDEYRRCWNGSLFSSFEATFYWSIKEAYLKALGVGLRLHPQLVEVPPRAECNGRTMIYVRGDATPVELYWTTLDDFYIITNTIIV